MRKALEDYLDGASFVLDQSLRGILAGLGPDDLRHFVTFPKYLDDAPFNLQNYGEISTYSPAIFYQAIGWYDNNAANMKPIAPAEEAKRLVPLMGGRDKVLEAARDALDKKEYAWAARLADQVYLIDNQDMDARQLKADALRQMAYVSTGGSDRAHLMSQALALEGKVNIARVVPPPPALVAARPTTFVNYFRVRIDPKKSDTTNKFIRFDFSDGSQAGLHVRRAVVEFVAEPEKYQRKPDVVLAMSGETWAKLYMSLATPEELIETGDIKVTGDAEEAARVINLFDRYSPAKAVVIPSAMLDHIDLRNSRDQEIQMFTSRHSALFLLISIWVAQPAHADNWTDFTGAEVLQEFVSDTSAEIDLRPGVTAVGQYNADGTAQITAWGETFDRTWEVVGENQVCYTALAETDCYTFEQNLDVPGEYRARNVETGDLLVFHVSETEAAVASRVTEAGSEGGLGSPSAAEVAAELSNPNSNMGSLTFLVNYVEFDGELPGAE